MTYGQFYAKTMPSVLELQEQCKFMTEKEFLSFREKVLQDTYSGSHQIVNEFVNAVFGVIYKNIFQLV